LGRNKIDAADVVPRPSREASTTGPPSRPELPPVASSSVASAVIAAEDARRARATPQIRDVAALAGVSVGTVSNVINHPERVTARTRTLVEDAIAELQFIPNQQARVIAGLSSDVIGLVVLDTASPFYMGASRAVEHAVRQAGHVVMLCNSESDVERERELLTMLAAQRVRGVLLTPADQADDEGVINIEIPNGLPVVFLDYEGGPDECSISVDNVLGARLAVEHLLRQGHERVAFIGGPPGLRQFTQRSKGVIDAIVGAGLDPDTALVEVSASGLGVPEGERAVELLLAGDLPSAIFCGNDMLAFGAYRGLSRSGIRVPEDVVLIGYDDIDFAQDWVVPISTVRQPIGELGSLAAQLLLEHAVGGEAHVHRQIVLTPELVLRASSDQRVRGATV
tara:strand:- start:3263 stop:4447 length:1185 start_codon:yes stop_codon:yes gene_type:complete